MKLLNWNRGLLMLGLSLLAACSRAGDYHYWMTHPQQTQAAYEACFLKADLASDCQAVKRAHHDLTDIFTNVIPHQQAYGEQIIRMQMQVAALKQQVQQTKQQLKQQNNATQQQDFTRALQQTEKKIGQLQAKIDHHLQLVGYIEVMAMNHS